METVTMEYLRKTQIALLDQFDAICSANGLQYFLSNGTLLGAVKYSGFIPWDDDIDVCMPRNDYNRLMEIMAREPETEGYAFFSCEINKDYLFPFAKMSDRKTLLIEKDVDNGVTLGINIDIFPLDGFGHSVEQARKIYKRMEKLRRGLGWAKRRCNYNVRTPKDCAKLVLTLFHRMIGAKKYVEKICRYAQSFSYDNSAFTGNSVWGFYGDGEYHKKSVFAEAKDLQFEERTYPCPIGYHDYLTKLYGDYVADPPADKQVTHHSFQITIL